MDKKQYKSLRSQTYIFGPDFQRWMYVMLARKMGRRMRRLTFNFREIARDEMDRRLIDHLIDIWVKMHAPRPQP